ncbi:MAG: choice-of-anchor Q domain-containing protein [Dokdonella sp.]
MQKQTRSRVRHRWLLGVMVAIAATTAHAGVVFNVDTTADLVDADTGDGLCRTSAGNCSLRAAITQSNYLPAPFFLSIHVPAGIYVITRPIPPSGFDGEDAGDFNLRSPPGPNQTVILGAGPALTVIDGNQLDSILRLDPARTATIDGVTLRNGKSIFSGGAIQVEGSLTISNCVIEDNHARLEGGAINMGISSGSSLSVIGSTLRANVADNGGGIAAFNNVSIRDSALYGNTAMSNGGGVYNDGQLVVSNSTISGNAANTNGGGIYNRINASIYSTSVVNNDADHDRDENGGIGGGIYNDAGARFVAVNSLFTSNTVLDAPIPNNCNGVLEVYGNNLFDEISGCTFSGNGGAAWDFVAGNSVGPLQDNGGPTRTHALLAGSTAIDATNAQGCIDQSGILLPTDQRGAPRVAGLRCDVGSFEFGAVSDRIFGNGFE